MTELPSSIVRGVTPVTKPFSLNTQGLNGQAAVLKVDQLPVGTYRVDVRALDRANGTVLFQATREIGAKLSAASGNETPQNLVLDRSKGDIQIEVTGVNSAEPLVYTASIGLFSTTLKPNGALQSGRITNVPTGKNQFVIVHARDRVGTLRFQGYAQLDVLNALQKPQVLLRAVEANSTSFRDLKIEATEEVVVKQAGKLAFSGTATGTNATGLHRVVIDWGDGSQEISTLNQATLNLTRSHTWDNVGAQLVILTMIAPDGMAQQAALLLPVKGKADQTPPNGRITLLSLEIGNTPIKSTGVTVRLIPKGAPAGGGGRVEPTQVSAVNLQLTQGNTPTNWSGVAQLIRGVTYQVEITAVASNYLKPLLSLGAVPSISTYADAQTERLVFQRPKVWQQGEQISLKVIPANPLFTEQGASKDLFLEAKDTNGNALDLDSLKVEWLSSDSTQISITNTTAESARIQSRAAVGTAVIIARLANSPEVRSNPVSAATIKLKRGVKFMDSSLLIFPNEELLNATDPKTAMTEYIKSNNKKILDFTIQEYASFIQFPTNAAKKFAVILNKNASFAAGDQVFLDSLQAAGVVTNVINRANSVLVQFEQSQNFDLIDDFLVDYDQKRLVEQGIIPDIAAIPAYVVPTAKPAAVGAPSNRSSGNARAGFKFPDLTAVEAFCGGNPLAGNGALTRLSKNQKISAWDALPFPNANIQNGIEFKPYIANRFRKNAPGNFLKVGMELNLGISITGNIGKVKVKFNCEKEIKKFLRKDVVFSFLGPAAFLLSGYFEANWTAYLEAAFQGGTGISFQFKYREVYDAGFKWAYDSGGIPISLFAEKRKVLPDEKDNDGVFSLDVPVVSDLVGKAGIPISTALEFGTKINGKFGLSIFPAAQFAFDLVKGVFDVFNVDTSTWNIPVDLEVDILKLSVGPEAYLVHNNDAALVLENEIIDQDIRGDLATQFTIRPLWFKIEVLPTIGDILGKIGVSGAPLDFEGNLFDPDDPIFGEKQIVSRYVKLSSDRITKEPTDNFAQKEADKYTASFITQTVRGQRNVSRLARSEDKKIVDLEPIVEAGTPFTATLDFRLEQANFQIKPSDIYGFDLVALDNSIVDKLSLVPPGQKPAFEKAGARYVKKFEVMEKLKVLTNDLDKFNDSSTGVLISDTVKNSVGYDRGTFMRIKGRFRMDASVCDYDEVNTSKNDVNGIDVFAIIYTRNTLNPDTLKPLDALNLTHGLAKAYQPVLTPYVIRKFKIRCGGLMFFNGERIAFPNQTFTFGECDIDNQAFVTGRFPNVKNPRLYIRSALKTLTPNTYSYTLNPSGSGGVGRIFLKPFFLPGITDLIVVDDPDAPKIFDHKRYPIGSKKIIYDMAIDIDSWDTFGRSLLDNPCQYGVEDFWLNNIGKATASARRDPHIGTFDGPRHSVHALGEFDYIRPQDPTVKEPRLQVRHELQRAGQPFAIATALALKYRGHTVEVRANKTPHLWIDGVPTDYKFLELEKGFTVDVDPNTGSGKIYFGNVMTEFQNIGGAFDILARAVQKTPIVGLMGSPDGIPGNNHVGPDGKDAPSSAGEIAFGELWRVPENESQFTYNEGSYTAFNKKNVYLNQLPTPEELAPFLEQARTLLNGTCDTGTSTDAGLEEAALDLYSGMTQLEIMAHLCNYQVFGKVKNRNAPDVPFLGSVVKMTSTQLGTCSIASDATGYFSCTMPPKPGAGVVPKVSLELDGEQFDLTFDRRAKPGEILSIQKDLEVSPTTLRLKGKVLDPEGQPVRLAKIQIQAPGQLRTVTTDENGLYDLYIAFVKSQADRDVLYNITVNSPGLRFTKRAGVRLIAGGLKEVTEDLQLVRSIKFSGQVQNALLPGHSLGGVLTIRRVGGVQLCQVVVQGHTRLGSDEISALNYVSTGGNGASASATYTVGNQSFREYKYDNPDEIPSPAGGYVCTADVSTLGAFDADFELKGDWGTSVTRVQVPAKLAGTSQEEEPFVQDLEGRPAVVRFLGRVLDNAGQPQSLFAGLLTDNKLFAADASFRMGLGSAGFELAAVLKEGIIAGAVRLQSSGAGAAGILYGWKEYLIVGAAVNTVVESVADLRLGERTVAFSGVLKNALTNAAIPGEVVISSPQAGELCRASVAWKTRDNLVPPTVPDGTYSCTATIKQFGDIDVIYQARGAWGDAATALRNVLPAAKSSVAQDIQVNAAVLRVSGVVKNRLGNTVSGALVRVPETSEAFDPLYMASDKSLVASGADGNYGLDLLLKAGVTSGQFDVEASLEGTNSGFGFVTPTFANAQPTAKLPVAANIEISSGRVVKFIGQANNGHLESAPLRGRVVIKHISGTEICATQVEISGQYSCTIVLQSAAAFTVTHTLTGDWGESISEPTSVPEGRANTVSKNLEGLPTTVEVTGRVRDTGDVQVSGGAVTLLGDTGFLSSVSTSEYQTGVRGEYRLVLVLKPNAPRARLEVLARYFKAEGKNLIDIQNVQAGQFKVFNLDLLVARPVQIAGTISNRFVPSMTLPGAIRAKLADGTELCQTTAGTDGKFSCFGRITTSGSVQATYTVESFWGAASQTAMIPAGHAYNTSESSQDLSLPATTVKFAGKLIDTTTNGAPYRGKVKISGFGTVPLELDADNTTGAYAGYSAAPANNPISVLWQARDTANNVAVKTLGVTAAANVVTEVLADLRLETRTPGTARWANLTGGSFLAAPAVGTDGTLYYLGVAGNTLRLYAVAIDGSPRWELDVKDISPNSSEHSAPMIGRDGTIYVAHAGEIIAVRSDASIRWRYVFDVTRGASGMFAATRDRIALLKMAERSDQTNALVLLSSAGVVQKTIDFGAVAVGYLRIGNDGTIYLQAEQQLLAFNPDGSKRWSVENNSPLAIGHSGELYLPTSRGLEVVSANLRPLWQTTFAARQVTVGAVGQIYALNSTQVTSLRSDGTTRWITTTANGTQFRSMTLGNDDLLYVAAERNDPNTNASTGLVIAYKPDGTEAWRFSSPAPMSQITMGVDGTVYGGGDKLYAINSTATAPLNGAWIQHFAGIGNQNAAPANTDARRLIKITGVLNNANLTTQVLENYKVQVNRADGTLFCNAVTDALGRYECSALSSLDAQNLQLEFQGIYGNLQRSISLEAGAADSQVTSQQDASLAVTTLILSGRVVDHEQKPLANASVKLTGQITDTKTTDAQGNFSGIYRFAPDRTRVLASVEVSDGVATVISPLEVVLTPKALTRSEPVITINRFAPGMSRWRTKLPGDVIGSPVTNSIGITYVTTTTAKLVEVKTSGQIGWIVALSAPSSFAPTIASDGTVYVSVGTALEAYTSAGALKWRYTASTALSAPITLDHTDRPVLATRDSITALEITGGLRWKFDTTDAPIQIAIGGDSTIFALSPSGSLRAVSATGQPRWTRAGVGSQFAIAATGHPVFTSNTAITWLDSYGDDARVVTVAGITGKALLALKDGRVVVTTIDQIVIVGSDNVVKSINMTAHGLAIGEDNFIYALHPDQIRGFTATGSETWRATGDPDLVSVPSISNGQLLVVTGKDTLMALNISSQGLASGWSRFGANQMNASRTELQPAVLGRIVKFTGSVANQFNLSQKLAGYEIEIRESSNRLLCRTYSDVTGTYLCASPIVPATSIATKYAVSKRWSDTELDSAELIGAVDAASNGDETPVGKALAVPLTTLRVFGIVKNGDGLILPNATVSIQSQGERETRVTTDNDGKYSAYFSFRPQVRVTSFTVIATNGTENSSLQFEITPVFQQLVAKELNVTIGDRTGGALRWTVPSRSGETNIILDSADAVYLKSGVYTTAGQLQNGFSGGNPIVVSSAGILGEGLSLARSDGTLRWNLSATVYSASPSSDGFHVISIDSARQYRYLNVSGNGVIRETTTIDSGWKVLGSPIVRPDGTALVIAYSPSGVLQFHRFNADGAPQMVSQAQLFLAPNATEINDPLTFQQPVPTSDNGVLLYTKGASSVQLSKLSITGVTIWSVSLSDLPVAAPVIAADGAIKIAVGTSILTFETTGQVRTTINIQPLLSNYSDIFLQGIAIGQDQSLIVTLNANGRMALLVLKPTGEKRWSYERLCATTPQQPSLFARTIRVALDGTVLTTLCSDVVAVTGSTLGLATTNWAAIGRDNQNSSRIEGDGQNRRTIRVIGKVKNSNLLTHLFTRQKVTVTNENNQVICQVLSDTTGLYRCGFDTSNRNAMTWQVKVDDEYGMASQTLTVAAGEFNTRTELEQDLLIPAKTLVLNGTLKLADGSLGIGKLVTFKLGINPAFETTSGNDGKYTFTFVYPNNQMTVTPELRFSDSGQDAIARPLVELTPLITTTFTQDLQLGVQAGGTERWRAALANGSELALAPNGSIRLLTDGYLQALNPDGSLLWRVPEAVGDAKIMVDMDSVTYIARGGFWFAYNPDGTRKYYASNLPNYPIGMTQNAARGFVIAYQNSIVALDRNATEQWRYVPTSGNFTTAPISLLNGNTVVGTTQSVMTLSPTGAVVSSLATPSIQNLILNGDNIILSAGSAIRAIQGTTQAWIFNANAANLAHLVADKDGVMYFSEGNNVVALNKDGLLRWRKDLGMAVGSLVIGQDGVLHVVGQTALVSLNPDGSLRWTTPTTNPKLVIAPVIAADGTIIHSTSTHFIANYTDSRGLASTWARYGANNANTNSFVAVTALNLPRVVKFRGSASNRFIPNSRLEGYEVDITTPDGRLLCNAKTNTNGIYECSSMLEATTVNVQYRIRGVLTTANFTSTVPMGSVAIEHTTNLDVPITTLKIEGTVQDVQLSPQAIINASIAIQTPALTTVTDSSGTYSFYIPYADGITQTNLQITATFAGNSSSSSVTNALTANGLTSINKNFVLDNRVLGAVARTLDLGGSIIGTPVIGSSGIIYVGSTAGVHAINPDGSERWRYSTRRPNSQVRLVPDQSIVFSDGSSVIKLRTDGTQDWLAVGRADVLAIASNGTIYTRTRTQTINGISFNLTALSSTGSLDWLSDVPTEPNAFAIAPDGGLITVSYLGLVIINPNGSKRWSKALPYYLYNPTLTLGKTGIWLVGSAGTLGFDYTGQQIWASSSLNQNSPSTSGLAIDQSESRRFIQDGQLVSTDASGVVQSQVTIPNVQLFTPTLSDDDTTYVLTTSGAVAVGSDNQIKWTYVGTVQSQFALPVAGRSVLLSQGNRLIWVNSSSASLKTNAAWASQQGDTSASRRLPSDGITRRYLEFSGKITHASIPNFAIANATVVVKQNAEVLCSTITTATGDYRCGSPTNLMTTLTATLEVTSTFGSVIGNVNVAAGIANSLTNTNTSLTISPTTVKITGQTLDSAQQPVGGLQIRVLNVPVSNIVTKSDGTVIPLQWSPLDQTSAILLEGDANGNFEVWITLPSDTSTTNFVFKALNPSGGGTANVTVQQNLSSGVLNTVSVPMTLQQTAQRIYGRIEKPNGQAYASTPVRIRSSVFVQAIDASNQSLGTGYEFNVQSNATGQYAITLNYLNEVTSDVRVDLTANIVGNLVEKSVTSTLQQGTVLQKPTDFSFDNTVLGVSNWRLALPNRTSNKSTTPAIANDGTIYSSQANKLIAVESSGIEKWRKDIAVDCRGDYVTPSNPVIRDDGVVLVVGWCTFNSGLSRLHAFSSSGAELWTFNIQGTNGSQIALGTNSTAYVAKNGPNELVAISALGVELWSTTVTLEYNLPGKLLIGPDETIYTIGLDDAYNGNSTITAINLDGSVRWTYSMILGLHSAAIGTDGTLFVAGSRSGYNNPEVSKLIAFLPSGKLSFTKNISNSNGNRTHSLIVLPNNQLLLARERTSTIYNFNGDIVQNLNIGGYAIGADGLIYGRSNDDNGTSAMSLLNVSQWEFLKSGQGAIGTNYLYLQTGDELLAINTGAVGLANTSWASEYKNQFNTSRIPSDGLARRFVKLTGLVKQAANNLPVGGATVVIQMANGDQFCTTTSDGNGNYSCGSPTEEFNAFVLEARVTQSPYGTTVAPVQIPAAASGSTTLLNQDLAVARAQIRFTGIVTDRATPPNPISGAVIQINGDIYGNTTTDSSGLYSLLLDVNRTSITIQLKVNDAANQETRSITISPPAGQITERIENFQFDQMAIGAARWAFKTDGNGSLRYSVPAIDSSGNIYLTNSSGLVVSLSPTGQERWRKTLQGFITTPVIGISGIIFVSDTQKLYAFDSAGIEVWSQSLQNDGAAKLAVTPSGAVIALSKTKIRRFSQAGLLEWTQPVSNGESYSSFSPVVLTNEQVLYCISPYYSGSGLYALNADGSQAWRSTVNCNSEIALATTEAFVSNSGSLTAVSLVDGQPAWNYLISSFSGSNTSSPLVDSGGNITWISEPGAKSYYGSRDAVITTVSSNGSLVRNASFATPILGSLLFGSDGTLFVPTINGVVALDQNLQTQWTYNSINESWVYGTTITSQGLLLVNTSDKLLAINTGLTGLLATAPWAKAFGNLQNMGRN